MFENLIYGDILRVNRKIVIVIDMDMYVHKREYECVKAIINKI